MDEMIKFTSRRLLIVAEEWLDEHGLTPINLLAQKCDAFMTQVSEIEEHAVNGLAEMHESARTSTCVFER
jgi:hypothetical protein